MPDGDPLLPEDPAELGGYRLAGRLGEGSQGVVYLGRDAADTRVAIKLLHARMAADPGARDRFMRELSAAKKVARFCTAQVIDADLAGDHPYIVSEYVDGRSLRSHIIADGPRTGGTLERLAIGTLTALAAIHRAGIVHRDFTPHNVLLGPDGPRVIDFGIARALNVACEEETNSIGTPAYMAPEQVTAGKVGPPADMFAWGATILFAGTGRPPFGNESVPAVMERVLHSDPDVTALPDPLRSVVSSCLSKDPARRPTAQQAQASLLGHDASVALMPPPAFGISPVDPEETVTASALQEAATPSAAAPDETGPGRMPSGTASTSGSGLAGASSASGPDGRDGRDGRDGNAPEDPASRRPGEESGADPTRGFPEFAPPAFPLPGRAVPGLTLPPSGDPATQNPTVRLMLTGTPVSEPAGEDRSGTGTTGQNPVSTGTTGHNPVGAGTTGQNPVSAGTTGHIPMGAGTTGGHVTGQNLAGPSTTGANLAGANPAGASATGENFAAANAPVGGAGATSGNFPSESGRNGSLLSPAGTGAKPAGRRWMVFAGAGVVVAGVALAIPLWPGGGDAVTAPKTRPASVSESPTPTATAGPPRQASGAIEAAPAKRKPPHGCKEYTRAYTVAHVGTVRVKALVCRGGFTGTAVLADTAPKDAYSPCLQLRGHVTGPAGEFISTQVMSGKTGAAQNFQNGPKFRYGSKTKRTENWVVLNTGRCSGTTPAWQSKDKLVTG